MVELLQMWSVVLVFIGHPWIPLSSGVRVKMASISVVLVVG